MRSALHRIGQHDKRWGRVPTTSEAFSEACNRLRALVIECLKGNLFAEEIDHRFAFLLGMRVEGGQIGQIIDLSEERYTIKAFDDSRTAGRVAKVLCCWLEALREYDQARFDRFADEVRQVLENSPALNIRLVRKVDECLFYPRGARLMDEALVDDVLVWLESYPKAAASFEQALKLYQVGDAQHHTDLLNNLRVALEQLLKDLMRNRKTLENQRRLVLTWLKERGVHVQIRNMYEGLFTQYCDYQNQAVKHDQAHAPHDVEFMIYLTGTFMHHLLRLVEECPHTENTGK
jgi:hypothetical protein